MTWTSKYTILLGQNFSWPIKHKAHDIFSFMTIGIVFGDLGTPKFLKVINGSMPRSVEIEAQRVFKHLEQHVYEPCFGHVVQLKLASDPDTKWKHVPIEEKQSGRFVLSNLEPGTVYHVRVACKDNKIPPSVGQFSDALRFETVFRNLHGKSHESGENEKNGEEKNGASTFFQAQQHIVFNALFIIILAHLF